MSKTSIFSGVAFLSIFVALAAVAQAEYETYFSTSDAGWKVADVTPTGYVNPTNTNSGTNSGTKWYGTDGLADPASDWIALARQDGKFVDAVTNPSYGTNWTTANWISPTKADKSKTSNGYYAYELALYSAQATSLTGTLNLVYTSDDYLAAIYLNDEQIYGNKTFDLTSKGESGKWTSLETISLSEIVLSAGANNLVFLVHNTNAAGSNSNNATGFAVKGTFSADVQLYTNSEDIPAATPEPATALILLGGLIGLPFLRRKSK